MNKIILIVLPPVAALWTVVAGAQTPVPTVPQDTTGIYSERKDTLAQTVFTAAGNGNFLSRGKEIRTEVITEAGLCKMACCNLAESFANSASVTVDYADAVTGARQIRLLGQNGIYTQMLDENRPAMRGLAAPFGLNFVPGQWLESIQVAKGVTSVINGVEAMTGQINLEHRKPTDGRPLFLQASVMDDSKADLNVVSAFPVGAGGHWSTALFGHVDGNFMAMDTNGDGFMDDPRQLQFNLANRWLYAGPSGAQVRFGVRALRDVRTGGQMPVEGERRWVSEVLNESVNGYFKAGFPLNTDDTADMAVIADYTWNRFGGDYPSRLYRGGQHSVFVNLLFQDHRVEQHHLTLGVSEMLDLYRETFDFTSPSAAPVRTALNDIGLFGEYTFHSEDETTFRAIAGLRGDWFNGAGFRFSPRLTLRWEPFEALVFRANAGRGLRHATPIADNIGVLSSGRLLQGPYASHLLEDAWTFGANATWYFGEEKTNCLSFDYFRTQFSERMVVDYDTGMDAVTLRPVILFQPLSEMGRAHSFSDNFQADFSAEPVHGLTLTLTGRFTDARESRILPGGDDIKPMTSRYKAVLNVQYATRENKWIFDLTASINGPCKVWDFMKGYDGMYADGYTPVYPLLYAQVTRRFKDIDLYIGGENLSGFRQPSPILGAADPFGPAFDASCIWGPIMGARFYAGVRISIWK